MSSNLFDRPETATIEIIGMDKPSYGVFGALTHRHLTIIAGERITLSTAVSIEHRNNLWMGDVCSCEQLDEGCFEIGITVAHKLTGLDSLMRLRAELLGLQFVATGQRAT